MIISCIDIETTGLDKSIDRIVQLSIQNFNPETGKLLESRNWYIRPNLKTGEWAMDVEAQKVHGISEIFLRDNGVSLKDIYEDWKEMTKDHCILTYNGTKFDIPMIQKDFEREGLDTGFQHCMFIDALDIERRLGKHESNKLGVVYERYFGQEFENAHDSSADILATIKVYMKQLELARNNQDVEYKLRASINQVTGQTSISPEGFVCRDEFQHLIFRFGKYKGRMVTEICKEDPGYIRWLWGSGAICNITKNTIAKEYRKINN